jgi:murein DD-endopeptidase MepM/ murein hydrolase activator NlpD
LTLPATLAIVPAIWEGRPVLIQDSHNAHGIRHVHRRQAVRRQAQHHHWRFYKNRPEWSFVQNFARAPLSWRREKVVLVGLGSLLALLAFVVLPGWASIRAGVAPPVPRASVTLRLPPAAAPVAAAPEPVEAERWTTVEVARGQTMGDIFAALALSSSDLQRLLSESSRAGALTRIKPGDRFAFRTTGEGRLAALRFAADEASEVTLTLEPSQVAESVAQRPIERRVTMANGSIEHSLFGAGEDAGLSDAMILQLAAVFGYDIDFAQDLRRGDRFAVVYEQVYRDGERLRDGQILAASFINDGKRFLALRHALADGRVDYFAADGRSLRKAFLRTPVEFTRISSRFSSARRHPILGLTRAHRGVDYAAPKGTPIKAAGAGKVAFRGWKSGYGNCIILEHGGKYSTLYGHLSRFAPGVALGRRVVQGETIGYVGMTGLATAPHLHYEFRVHGAHRDPLTVELPKADPLVGADLAQFKLSAARLLSQLALVEGSTPAPIVAN